MFEVFLKQKPQILALFHSLPIVRLSLALAYSSFPFRTELAEAGVGATTSGLLRNMVLYELNIHARARGG